MKPNTTGKYKHLTKLPKNAMKVKEFAKAENITEQYVYNKVRKGENDNFEIIVFMGTTERPHAIHGRNYVVPL